ncbi:MAG TPA: T9SS type A sorting domain-containing protein [Flavisolibacter sp.]|nr:T9SS type A sorting domain-containing protein [Flavisolibacter sp.]
MSALSLGAMAQTVTIVPTGTVAKPNLIPEKNGVTFSINPVAFGSCMNNLSYSWAIVNAAKDTVLKSTAAEPRFFFDKLGSYTVSLTVKTLPGGSCTANITKTATSTIMVGKDGGPGGVPKPTMFSANDLGTMISAYAVDNKGVVFSGPYEYFDPFPADNAITAALSMDDIGNFFYLPTFMNGSTPVNKQGVVEVWAVDKNGDHAPVVVASFDMNGSKTTELGLYRMGLDQKGNAWILAGDGTSIYAATFKTNGTKVIKNQDIEAFPIPLVNGSASDFQSGDLAFDNNGNMYVLAGSSTGVNIYTMSTNTASPVLTKKWKVTDAAGKPFGLAVTGTVFDGEGNMYFSALDGIYFIDKDAVSAVTATAIVTKVNENFGLMDLATSQFPAAWTQPVGVLLPVNLTRFSGAANGKKVQLNWAVTANEIGDHFEIEQSTNGRNFVTRGVVMTSEKQGDESYTFTDEATTTENVYYRLKVVSKDEVAVYSNVLSFRSQNNAVAKLNLLQNPVSGSLNFNYTATENTTADVTIYAFNGIKIQTLKQNLQKGNNSIRMALNSLQGTGIYLLEVKEGNSSTTVKFVKQ